MTPQPQYVQQHRGAIEDAFDKLSAHLRHNGYDGGCSQCEPQKDKDNQLYGDNDDD